MVALCCIRNKTHNYLYRWKQDCQYCSLLLVFRSKLWVSFNCILFSPHAQIAKLQYLPGMHAKWIKCANIIWLQTSQVVIFLLSLFRLNQISLWLRLPTIMYSAYSVIHVLYKQCFFVVDILIILRFFLSYLIALFIDADSDLLKTLSCLSGKGGK